MVRYLDIILSKYAEVFTDARDHERAILASERLSRNALREEITRYYDSDVSRAFAEIDANDFSADQIEADGVVLLDNLDLRQTDPKKAEHNLEIWWNKRVKDFFEDLNRIDEATNTTYAEQIFSNVQVGSERFQDYAGNFAIYLANTYLQRASMKALPFASPQMQRTGGSWLGNLLGTKTQDIVNKLLAERKEAFDLHTQEMQEIFANALSDMSTFSKDEMAEAVILSEEDITDALDSELHKAEKGEHTLASPDQHPTSLPSEKVELKKLDTWISSLRRKADKTKAEKGSEKLAHDIINYLYAEDDAGRFNIHKLMDELIDTKGNSAEYNRYQQKCVAQVFNYVFDVIRGPSGSPNNEKYRNKLLEKENKAQANISKREGISLVTAVRRFDARLQRVKPADVQENFFEDSLTKAGALYGNEGRRVSSAEKNRLKNDLVDNATDISKKLDNVTLSFRDTVKTFIKDLTEWVASKFTRSADNAYNSTGALSNSSTSTQSSRFVGRTTQEFQRDVDKFAPPTKKDALTPPKSTPPTASPGA